MKTKLKGKAQRSNLRSEEGITLVVVIMLMVILLSITGASLLLGGRNLQTANNLKIGAAALHVADAGIHRALVSENTGSAFTYGTDGSNPGIVLNSVAVPIVFAGHNNTITALDGPGADQATFTSTASGVGSSAGKAVVVAVVQRGIYPPLVLPGALSALGEVEAHFDNDAEFEIDGRDYLLDGETRNPCNPDKLGISVGDISAPTSQTPAEAKSNVIDNLSDDQKEDVKGLGYEEEGGGGDGDPATPSVDIDDSLTKSMVNQLVDDLEGFADSYQKVESSGGGCSGDITGPITNSTQANGDLDLGNGTTINMGTVSSPKIVFFDGVQAGTACDERLIFDGDITGAGVLVMKDNDLGFKGELDWKGVIIVSGPDTAILFSGGSNDQEVVGGVVVNETDTDQNLTEINFTSGDEVEIMASQAALDIVQDMLDIKLGLKIISWRQQF